MQDGASSGRILANQYQDLRFGIFRASVGGFHKDVGDALAERAGRRFDAGRVAVFGVAGRFIAELAEIHQIFLGNVVSEQWVVQIEISRVGELQYLEPKSADAVKRNDKAEQKGNDVGYQVQPLHVGVLAGHDFFKVALLQMSQVYVQKHRHYYEQRNSELELSEQLCEEHADVAHFTEPHPVGYKVGKRH